MMNAEKRRGGDKDIGDLESMKIPGGKDGE